MANVNVKFNNKDYLLSCDDGQEKSLKKLTEFLDKKYSELKDKLGNIGENKLLLITTIKLIDEYFDLKQRVAAQKMKLDQINECDYILCTGLFDDHYDDLKYYKNLLEKNINYLHQGVKFIIPLPEVKVFSFQSGEIIEKLQLHYNRTRQAAITGELIEIISGAESL